MGVDYLQSNLTGGEISPLLHARTDIEKYGTSLAIAENVVIVPQGGLRRRAGLSKVIDGKQEDARLTPFVFNKSQQYLFVFKPLSLDIYNVNDVKVATITTPYSNISDIRELDIIQSADTMIITLETQPPQVIIRGSSEAIWSISDIELTLPTVEFLPEYANNGTTQVVQLTIGEVVLNQIESPSKRYRSLTTRANVDLSLEDYNSVDWEVDIGEDIWSAKRGYPAVCAFHQNRLWMAGSTQKPTTVLGSRTNGFFDFTAVETSGSIPDDHAIFDTLITDQYNKISNIFSGRNLQVYTTGAEFVNDIPIITPSSSSWKSQTGYGSQRIRPIFIDGTTLFVDSSGKNIRDFVFNFNEDAYVAKSITLLATHLFNNIVSMSSIKGTSLDVSDFVYIVNGDGTVAVMNTLRSEGVLGWTHWTTSGEFIDVAVVDKNVYFLVKRNGEYFIEKLNEDTYTDHNVIRRGTKPTTNNVISGVNNVVNGLNNVVFTDFSTGTAITTIQTNYDTVFDNTVFSLVADFSIMPSSTPTVTAPGVNHFDITRDAYRLEVGLDFTTNITMLPISTNLQNGSTLHRRKRVTKVDVNIFESLGIYIEDLYAPDRQFVVTLDEAPGLQTGFKEVYLQGYGRIVQFKIYQKDPLPMLIRAIGYEINY